MKTILLFILVFFCVFPLKGQYNGIAAFLKDSMTLRTLHYPQSVVRFYDQNQYEYAWMKTPQGKNQSTPAILLLEEAYLFGLSATDYQPKGSSFARFKTLSDFSTITNPAESVRFDVFLTDALITFINHLHFGKHNPYYPKPDIDAYDIEGFRADEILMSARQGKDFRNEVLKAQPTYKAYTDLQSYLNSSDYAGDFKTSETAVRKIIINMERLRWINLMAPYYILVNIPSFTLEVHREETVSTFKVIVGKPSNKSPVLKSAVSHFTTAPDWIVPQSIFVKEMLPKMLKSSHYLTANHYSVYNRSGIPIKINSGTLKVIARNPYHYSVRQAAGSDNALGAVVFRFPNPYSVYLHDTAQPKLFLQEKRALSHGCIRVERAKELAVLLLKHDGSANEIPVFEKAVLNYTRKDFILKQPVPIMIAYLTCMIQEGIPVVYGDLYDLDTKLEALFEHP